MFTCCLINLDNSLRQAVEFRKILDAMALMWRPSYLPSDMHIIFALIWFVVALLSVPGVFVIHSPVYLGQSYHCPIGNELTLKIMGK